MKTQKGPENYTAGLCLSWNLSFSLLTPNEMAFHCSRLTACRLVRCRLGSPSSSVMSYQVSVAYGLALPPIFVIVNADDQSLHSFHWSWTRHLTSQTLLPASRNCKARRRLCACLATAVSKAPSVTLGNYVCVYVHVHTQTITTTNSLSKSRLYRKYYPKLKASGVPGFFPFINW